MKYAHRSFEASSQGGSSRRGGVASQTTSIVHHPRRAARVAVGAALVAMVASCGPDGDVNADASEGEAASEAGGSAADGMTSTSGGGASTTGGETGAASSGGASLDGETGAAAGTRADQGQEGSVSGELDSTTATTSTSVSTDATSTTMDATSTSTDATSTSMDASNALAEASTTSDPVQTCDGVAACNDHGSCIESIGGLLCDCEVEGLPTCELPLVREIGSSGTDRELILTNISADGTVIVGSHAPFDTPREVPAVAVQWTLDGGLEMLELDPAGDNVAMNITVDHRVIVGYVKVSQYPDEWVDVVWRDGVLEVRDPDEEFDFGGPRPPTPVAQDVEVMLEELSIEHWPVEYVNAISADGKVMFWLGHGPDRWKRWQLRLP